MGRDRVTVSIAPLHTQPKKTDFTRICKQDYSELMLLTVCTCNFQFQHGWGVGGGD